MARCLLTGADGFVGSNVLKYLLDRTDWGFVCLCSWRHRGNPLNIPLHERVEVIRHDLTGEVPDLGSFTHIVNLASESHVDRSITDPVPFVENNVAIVLQMLEYARRSRPQMFLHFSTDEIYGATGHSSWDVLLPSNPYAASKAAQEMIAIAYWKTYTLPVVLTNSNNIIGPGQNPEKFLPKIIDLIKNDQQVTIHALNGRPGRRHWNPVQNIADALLTILGQPVSMYPTTDRPDRYALSGGQELDNLEMAQLIAKKLNKDLKYRLVDAESVRTGYDEFYGAATGGMLEALGWTPPLTLEEGLEWVR